MGTHPIFESDFDCLTDLLKMTLGSRISQIQVSIFDKLRFFRGLQGVRQLNKKISLLGERQSWSSLGNTDLSKLTVLYETKANPFIFNRANPYFYHILLFMGGCALIKLYNYVTAIDEKSPLKKRAPYIRASLVFALIVLTAHCVLAPSRTVRSVQIISSSSRNAVVFECGRFFGTTPTFYVFDGYEEKRIVSAYDAEWNKRNKRGMMPNNMIEKIREEDRKKRAQGYPGRIGDIRFTNEGSVRLPSGLRLSGEGPLFLPTLNLNLHHGLVRVKRSQLRRIQERQYYANTGQLINDILKAVHAGQLKMGIEKSVIEDSSKDPFRIFISALLVLTFLDTVQPFESFGQPSYFNSVLIPKLYNRVTSSSSELMEGGKKELPVSPIYNLNVTDEEED